ncbi:hypothetical protein BDAP_002780 [Binucleata daphniae]
MRSCGNNGCHDRQSPYGEQCNICGQDLNQHKPSRDPNNACNICGAERRQPVCNGQPNPCNPQGCGNRPGQRPRPGNELCQNRNQQNPNDDRAKENVANRGQRRPNGLTRDKNGRPLPKNSQKPQQPNGLTRDKNGRPLPASNQKPQNEAGKQDANKSAGQGSDDCTALFGEINKYRQSKGKEPFQKDAALDKAAKVQSDYMAQTQKLSHTGPPGGSFFGDRITNAGGNAGGAVENICECINNNLEANKMWINSPGHNDNLLSQTSKIGLASAKGQNGRHYVTMVASN